MKPKALILQSHGANRDLDVMEALTLAGADAVGTPLNELRIRKTLLADFQLLVLPGGFSYADALGAGKLLGLDLSTYFADETAAFVDSGKPVIGICNGFQALVKANILPGRNSAVSQVEERASGQATLTFNAHGNFECRWVTLKPASPTCLWTKGSDEIITCPIAHGEGNFQSVAPLAPEQITHIYVHADGSPACGSYPANPNGSISDIAGICNPQGNVLGLMPHPENHIHSWQHPRHTRGETGGTGLKLFETGVKYAIQL